jgi:asparagine synthase (glutamine-hydrolysing)
VSALVGVFPLRRADADRGTVRAMLDATPQRGADCTAVRHIGSAVLGVSRHAWELEAGSSGPVLIAHDGGIAVIADASLYYRGDLERALAARGVRPLGATPSHLILAAYQAWGDECAAHLEGDFAFIVWNSRTQHVLAARDFAGKRPLFHARVGNTLIVASSIAAIRAHPACPHDLDLTVLAEEASALTGSCDQTCWRAIRRLPPGATLRWHPERDVQVSAPWEPPPFRDTGGGSFDDAAAELRDLLCAAVRERLASSGPTAVALSGGWDAPAVFAAARHTLDATRDARCVVPISMSFPVGDPGREDDVIVAVARHWCAEPRWLRSDDISPLAELASRAAARDEPRPHPFEMIARALARTAASVGARVMLDGGGGDHLFQVSDVYLADLLAGGRWLALARERRAREVGWVPFLRHVLRPRIVERVPPRWIRPELVRAHGLLERERRHVPARALGSRAARESRWQLVRPHFGRTAEQLASFAMAAGVEHRSPLCDLRVVRFAASRPTAERHAGVETKRLLRRAMAGLLPAEVLAPRHRRTGDPSRYLTRALDAELPRLLHDVLREPLLADLGIIDPTMLRMSWGEALLRGDRQTMIALYLTLEAELWLRAHLDGAQPAIASHAAAEADDRAEREVGTTAP